MPSNTTSLGFEEKIWKAADMLRGNLSPSQYQSVVLGLIFLKYISDKFDAKYNELLADEYADEEDKDEYQAENVFYVPANARWQIIADAAHSPKIGVVIDEALRSIEKENESLKGILPGNYSDSQIDKTRLGEVVDLFTNIDMEHSGDDNDLLGRVYEYCLQKFALFEAKSGGAFYTPSCVVRTLVEIMQPYKGRIYDPCCGSGGMFVQSAKFVQSHQSTLRNISIYGQEFNSNTWKMCQMNLAIRGLDYNLGETFADTFSNDQHSNLKADFILANPPFNLSDWGQSRLLDDKRWAYGLPPSGNANFAWIQHMIHHLAPKGRMGLVLSNGALTSQSGGEGAIRKAILEADLAEGIVSMPGNLFYNVTIPVTLWFINRNKKQPGKVVFIDATGMGRMVTRTVRELTDSTVEAWSDIPEAECDVQKLAKTFHDYEEGTLKDVKGFCKVATLDEIAKQDHVLTPGRYVGIADEEEDPEPFEEKMVRLTDELGELFRESRKHEENIRKQLKRLGWEL